MSRIVAIYGSPRRQGNTAALLDQAVAGARSAGATVEPLVLRDLEMSPCLEIYGCKKDGRCVIQDDFQRVYDLCLASQGLMLASPIFFYAVSAHAKIMLDRFQSLWVKKYWIERRPFGQRHYTRQGLFISAGATQGAKLFEGALRSVRYFMDVLDMELVDSVLCRGLDLAGDVLGHPEHLARARQAGQDLALALRDG
ncbi:MAG: flavodoxin family protein [Desulfarculus sp.]|nr:MAG: flavodoxin family protein [Desulfarculus sp.]